MRTRRRTAFVVAVGLAIALGGLASGHRTGHGGDRTPTGEAAFDAQRDGLGAAAATLERDQRRESVTSQRGPKHALLFFVLAVAVSLAGAGRVARRAAAASIPPTLASTWSRSRGRAPPLFQLAVV